MISSSGLQNACVATAQQTKRHPKISAAQQRQRCIVRESVAGHRYCKFRISLTLLLRSQLLSPRICFSMENSNFRYQQTSLKTFKAPYWHRNPTGSPSEKKRIRKIRYTAQNLYG